MKNFKSYVVGAFLVFYFNNAISQVASVYVMDKNFTRHRLGKFKTPSVFLVEKKTKVSQKPVFTKKINPEYENLKKEVNFLVAKEKKEKEIYDQKLVKYNEINSIITNIKFFLKSSKPLELKKNLLIISQKIATKYKINELVYADATINKTHKAKFLVLSLNILDLKVHFSRVILRIEKLNTKPGSFIKKSNELENLKKELLSIEKYNLIRGKTNKEYTSNYFIKNKIEAIQDVIVGNFKEKKEYYIMSENIQGIYKKNQLVEKLAFEKIDATADAKKEIFLLIENIDSKNQFLVSRDFFINFAYTFDGKFRYQVKDVIANESYE